jgi:hypothetical protein
LASSVAALRRGPFDIYVFLNEQRVFSVRAEALPTPDFDVFR